MKIVCLSFTKEGEKLGNRLKCFDKHVDHYINSQIKGGIKNALGDIWHKYDGIIFISSTGIAVRLINPYIKDKVKDPAVVVLDDMGKFSISLLSGHLGGANELAKWIGDKINALPIITTASDNRGIEAIDLFAKKNGYHIVNMEWAKKITAMMVNGKNIGFYSEDNVLIDYPNIKVLKDLNYIDSSIEGLIIVSSEKTKPLNHNIPYIQLIPKNINIGIGCRKGVEGRKIIEAVEKATTEVCLSNKGIKAIGTVEIKKDEEGIIEAAKHFNCPMIVFTIDEIKKVEDKFDKSQFVKDTIGVYSVSEPSAFLLGGEMITKKSKYNGITISISKEIKNG